MKSTIYQDPLTGLPNFFKFIETDVKAMFKGSGSVIIFDMVSFEQVNTLYGREVGDMFLITFSKTLKSVLVNIEGLFKFRTHGDEFTIILPNFTQDAADELSQIIKQKFINTMMVLNFNNVDLHILILSYSDNIESINQFYQMMFFKSFNDVKQIDNKYCAERIVENIVGNFTNRIQETLTLLNDAYNLVLTDDISTLPNQRAAKLYLKNLMKESSKAVKRFSVLFIDGDNLKRYNQISYSSGNEMIKSLSSVISSSLRKNDKIFRWLTGDEFLVILEDVSNEDDTRLAERVRSLVEEQTKEWNFPVTVSIGMSSYPDDGNSIEEVLTKSEKANIIAKNSGKNKVVQWKTVLS
jgi:diguanylate cyclase (GGDEF)-like protein